MTEQAPQEGEQLLYRTANDAIRVERSSRRRKDEP
jgi:hypothetical protein